MVPIDDICSVFPLSFRILEPVFDASFSLFFLSFLSGDKESWNVEQNMLQRSRPSSFRGRDFELIGSLSALNHPKTHFPRGCDAYLLPRQVNEPPLMPRKQQGPNNETDGRNAFFDIFVCANAIGFSGFSLR